MSKIKLSSNASGTGNVTVASPATNSDRTITLPDGDGAMPLMKLETAKTATGTAVDFTSIPSWVKRITVMFSNVSTNSNSLVQIQMGNSGGVETSGYVGTSEVGSTRSTYSAGFLIDAGTPSATIGRHGVLILTNFNLNNWIASINTSWVGGLNVAITGAGSKTLSDVLTQIRITTVNGTDVFDAGTINIMYEG
jgi:hypothetical protein